MNVANLQVEGLLMAIASINGALVEKGVLSAEDIALALERAEANITGDDRVVQQLNPSNRDAICFPVRFLLLANNSRGAGEMMEFSELVRMVGQTKEPYNDQI